MKNLLLLCLVCLLFSCKKKEEPVAEPEPEKYGNVTIALQTFDSLGDPLADASNVRVRLNAASTASTDASGKVVFPSLPYGNYFPEPFREGWEAAPTLASLNAPAIEVLIPLVKRSGFKLQNLSSKEVSKDSVLISFTLDKMVPSGKFCKVAIITSTAQSLSGNDFQTADQISVNSTSTTVNIVKLKNLSALVANLDSTTTVFLNAIPVSYGIWTSNLVPKPLLLGDNLFTPNYLVFKKNWK